MANARPLVVFLPTQVVGGHEFMLLEWLAVAAEQGLNFEVHCEEGSELVELVRPLGFSCRTFAPRQTIGQHGWRWGFGAAARIARKMKSVPRGRQILLAPGAVQGSLFALMACVLLRKRIYCYVPMAFDSSVLGKRFPGARDWWTKLLASKVALWVTINDQQRDLLRGRWKITAPIHVVPNRLRVLKRAPDAVVAPRRVVQSPLRVLVLGRFDGWQKGLDWLVDVLRDSPGWTHRLQFPFQGRGDFQPVLESLAEQHSQLVSVRSWGPSADALAEADVLLMTSRFEGFPLVAIEAIHAGVPVVATSNSGLEGVLPAQCLYAFGDRTALDLALSRMAEPQERAIALAFAKQRIDVLLSSEAYALAVKELVDAIQRMQHC